MTQPKRTVGGTMMYRLTDFAPEIPLDVMNTAAVHASGGSFILNGTYGELHGPLGSMIIVEPPEGFKQGPDEVAAADCLISEERLLAALNILRNHPKYAKSVELLYIV